MCSGRRPRPPIPKDARNRAGDAAPRDPGEGGRRGHQDRRQQGDDQVGRPDLPVSVLGRGAEEPEGRGPGRSPAHGQTGLRSRPGPRTRRKPWPPPGTAPRRTRPRTESQRAGRPPPRRSARRTPRSASGTSPAPRQAYAEAQAVYAKASQGRHRPEPAEQIARVREQQDQAVQARSRAQGLEAATRAADLWGKGLGLEKSADEALKRSGIRQGHRLCERGRADLQGGRGQGWKAAGRGCAGRGRGRLRGDEGAPGRRAGRSPAVCEGAASPRPRTG